MMLIDKKQSEKVNGMKINEVSLQFKISQDTLRYYEKIGLLGPILKDKCGNRDYQDKDIQRLKFLKCMREAGLSIQVLQEYIALYNQGDKTREERRNLLISQRDHLIEKKACIQKSIEQLNHKIENDEELLNKHI
jgi:DNA-binding transcriptional MerR regulator